MSALCDSEHRIVRAKPFYSLFDNQIFKEIETTFARGDEVYVTVFIHVYGLGVYSEADSSGFVEQVAGPFLFTFIEGVVIDAWGFVAARVVAIVGVDAFACYQIDCFIVVQVGEDQEVRLGP